MMMRCIHMRDLAIVCMTITLITVIQFMYQTSNVTTMMDSQLHNEIARKNAVIRNLQSQRGQKTGSDSLSHVYGKNIQALGLDYLHDRTIQKSRILDRNYKPDLMDFQNKVTLLIYSDEKQSLCLSEQISENRKILPDIKILVASQLGVDIPNQNNIAILLSMTTEGQALNTMISKVKTDYFLYLSEGAVVSKFDTDNGPGWLLHNLESVPEVDFVGGGYVRYNASLKFVQYEAQCYRLKMCHWVFSQSYEYQYSVGDMMVCEETSTSFMGRMKSVAKVGQFDEALTAMTTTEFFWRAKNSATVGLRPEVFFHVSKTCAVPKLSKNEEALGKQAFMDKYDLRRVKDSYGHVTDYPLNPVKQDNVKKVWAGFNHKNDGGVMTPVAYETMKNLLNLVDDFFRAHPDLHYFLDGGVPLGGIKMRNVLPWDGAMDIDTGYYGIKWPDLLKQLKDLCPDCSFSTGENSFGPPGMKHIEIRRPHGEGAYNELYTHEFDPFPQPDTILYLHINSRDIPLPRNFLEMNRQQFGINYLQTKGKDRVNIKCRVPGHHACVPDEFSHGGGHWKDFYCV